MRGNKEKDPKKSIYLVLYIFLGLFVFVIGYFTYFMVAQSKEVINSTYNKRQTVLAEQVTRGEILSADNQVLAKTTVSKDGKETREYPYGDVFAHVVGRYSKGITGIEQSENIRLLTSSTNPIRKMYNEFVGEKSQGNNVITTLDSNLQQVAYDALGDYRGAVVVMEPKTGKILAMVSKPAYDPNKVDAMWDELVKDDKNESTLLNRATQGLYPPGSTFKLLTTLTFIRENPDYRSYEYNCDGSIEYNGMVIHDYNNKSHGKVDLALSLAKSCNPSFSYIAESLDLADFHSISEKFLFNQKLPIELENNASVFTLNKGASGTKEAMQTAIGQGKTLVTPLHNAMIVSTIANGGVMMKPYVVDHVENSEGGMVKRYSPEMYARPMTSGEAQTIGDMMRDVVTEGTATRLNDMPVKAAGKTGSADHQGGKAHAWFVGYAPYNNPEIAVSVIVENVGTGSEYAVPIARSIFDAYFNSEKE